MNGRWASSTRARRLPPDWLARVAACRRRAHGRCEHVDHGRRCTAPGTDADHIDGDDNHDRLQWLCRPHHTEKTQREAAAARELLGRRRPATVTRPHPAARRT